MYILSLSSLVTLWCHSIKINLGAKSSWGSFITLHNGNYWVAAVNTEFYFWRTRAALFLGACQNNFPKILFSAAKIRFFETKDFAF